MVVVDGLLPIVLNLIPNLSAYMFKLDTEFYICSEMVSRVKIPDETSVVQEGFIMVTDGQGNVDQQKYGILM